MYEPEDCEETYSDYAGDNSYPDEDMAVCAETEAYAEAETPSFEVGKIYGGLYHSMRSRAYYRVISRTGRRVELLNLWLADNDPETEAMQGEIQRDECGEFVRIGRGTCWADTIDARNVRNEMSCDANKKAAPPVRTRPTDKSRDSYYHFTCKTPEQLRKILNTGTVDAVKAIAESYVEFQPRTDGKRMTKKYYVDAIEMLYFPQEQAKSDPAQKDAPDFTGEQFVEGKVYVKDTWGKCHFFKIIQRKKNTVTFAEVSPYDFTECLSAPKTRAVKRIRTATEYITPNGIWNGDLWAWNEYDRVYMMQFYTPGYDVEFDETAYSPDYEANSAVLDDVPENEYSGHTASLTVGAVKNAPTFDVIYEVLKEWPIEMHYALTVADRKDVERQTEIMRGKYEGAKGANMKRFHVQAAVNF